MPEQNLESYLLALFAILPSLVITVMYNFISTVEFRLSDPGLTSPDTHALLEVRRFVALSSKSFHLIMTYYFLMLTATLFTVGCREETVKQFLTVSTVVYLLYTLVYWARDAKRSLKLAQFDERWVFAFLLVFLTLPFVDLFIIWDLANPAHVHLAWLGLDFLFLVLWWLIVPFVFQPLTNLARAVTKQ